MTQIFEQWQAGFWLPSLLVLLVALALLFRGYQIFRLFLSLLGAGLAYVSSQLLAGQLALDQRGWLLLWGLLSLLLMPFFWRAYRICFFLAGAILAAGLTHFYSFALFGYNPQQSLLFAALLGGLLALFCCKLFLVGGTSLLGACMASLAIQALINGQDSLLFSAHSLQSNFDQLLTLALLPSALFVLGLIAQCWSLKNKPAFWEKLLRVR